eukprot:SAG31_NODE_18313_length_640_cov_2.009242_1_plen_56_part_10
MAANGVFTILAGADTVYRFSCIRYGYRYRLPTPPAPRPRMACGNLSTPRRRYERTS